MFPYLRKRLFLLLLLFPLAPAYAQLETFGDFSISGGSSLNKDFGTYPGATIHGLAGIQYGIFAISLGAGIIRPAMFFEPGTPFLYTLGFDFPAGVALRIPVRKMILVAGCDFSGLPRFKVTAYQPHLDMLFQGRWNDRGVFLKAIINRDGSGPGYLGAGLKWMLAH